MGVFYHDVSVTCALINVVSISWKLNHAPKFVIKSLPLSWELNPITKGGAHCAPPCGFLHLILIGGV